MIKKIKAKLDDSMQKEIWLAASSSEPVKNLGALWSNHIKALRVCVKALEKYGDLTVAVEYGDKDNKVIRFENPNDQAIAKIGELIGVDDE